ncbi:MAG TPA: ATP cone domain-containing protein, partial [Zeimonas sp.]|nr:ATP cone domain-containing protein [Zeimonas sp.]
MSWVAENAQSTPINPSLPAAAAEAGVAALASAWADYKVIRRNGAVVAFEPAKISIAMTKAFLAVNGGQGAASARVRELVDQLTKSVVVALTRGKPGGATFHIEDIQDHVELALMRSGEHEVARAYVLYRERRAQERAAKLRERAEAERPALHVLEGGVRKPLDLAALRALVDAACVGLGDFVATDAVLGDTVKNLYDGVPIEEVHKSAILSARALIEKDPAYSQVTARLLLHTV